MHRPFRSLVDRPGTEFDEQIMAVGDLVTFTCHQQFIEDKVGNKWPSGNDTVTIEAVNDTGDTAVATHSIVIS